MLPDRGTYSRYPIIPVVAENASPAISQRADAAVQADLGFPDSLVDDWQTKAVTRIGELVKERRGLRIFLDTCTKCGACTDKCHYFLGSGDPKNMPVGRQDLFRSVYRRHFTFAGKYFPQLVGARDFDEDMLEQWYRYFHQCSECRRCTVFCPKGIDTSEITMAGREVMASIGLSQHYTQEIIGKVHRIGNNLGLKKPALANVLESLEEDILDETGVPVRLPLDDADAELLLVTPSADFFAEPHVDGLIGYAKVLHESGIRWTFSSEASEAANFALFTGNHEHMRRIALRIRHAAEALGTSRLVIGECGHAWRVAYSYLEQLVGPLDFLDPAYPRAQHICELTYELLQQKRIHLDPSRNAGKVVTFHDSCNVARGAGMGDMDRGQFIIPRALIKASVPTLVEMSAATTGQKTFCCGGGGGVLADDLTEVRVAGSKPRADALRAVVESHQVTHMAAICAICKTQFNAVLPAHALGEVQIVSLHQLVGDALVLSEQTT